MRRILILLVALFAGAAALWHFERERRDSLERDGRAQAIAERATAAKDPPLTRDPLSELEDLPDEVEESKRGEPEDAEAFARLDLREGERALLSGEGKVTRRIGGDPPTTLLEVLYEDAQALDKIGLRYDFFELKVDSYDLTNAVEDAATAELSPRSEVEAGRARVTVEGTGLDAGIFADQLGAELFDVVVKLNAGLPFAPVILEAPWLTVDFETEELRSHDSDRVDFRSRNMRGTGVGLDARAQEGSFSFVDGADVQWTMEAGQLLKLSTPEGGPLTIADTTLEELGEPGVAEAAAGRGPRLARVLATDGVHAEFSEEGLSGGPRSTGEGLDDPEAEGSPESVTSRVPMPLVIDAASIQLDLQNDPGSEGPIIRSAQATGAVTIRHGRDVYRGESARVLFEAGEASRIIIEQSPSLTYRLAQPGGQEVPLRMTGQGPITGYLTGGTDENPELGFVFQGPGRIEAPGRGGVITFENEARGNGVRDRSQATVLLAGDVRVETPEGTMKSGALIALYRAGQDLRVATDGDTLIVSRNPETGDEYHVRAKGGMTAHLVEEAWFVDRAEDVFAEAYGKEPHRVRAGLITDVDVAARTLQAADDIEYESLWGRAVAGRALVRTAERVELEGSREAPVKLDLVEGTDELLEADADASAVRSGWIHAERLSFDATEIVALGTVAAQLETFEGVWGFDADELSLRREVTGESFLLDGGAAEPPVGAFSAGRMEDLFLDARFVREARYDAPQGNLVLAADRVELEAGAADADASDQAALDPSRPAKLTAYGRVTVDLESYGPDLDDQGLFTVQQTWRLAGSSATFTREPFDGAEASKIPFVVTASEVTECRFAGLGRLLELTSNEVEIRGELGAADEDKEASEVDLAGSSVLAQGRVDMRFKRSLEAPEMTAKCGLLLLENGTTGRMEPEPRGRVRATGVVPGSELKYELECTLLKFAEDELIAEAVENTKVNISLASSVQVGPMRSAVDRIIADRVEATSEVVALTGNPVYMSGTDRNGVETEISFVNPVLRVEDLKLMEKSPETIGPFDPVPPPAQEEDGQELVLDQTTSGGGEFSSKRPGSSIYASSVSLDPETGRPVFKDVEVALETDEGEVSMDAEFLIFDRVGYTLNAGRGAIRGGGDSPWTLQFAGIETREFDDELMFVITAPRVTYGLDSARANYVSIWVDRARWEALGAGALGNDPPAPTTSAPEPVAEARPNFLAEILFELQDQEFGGYVRALYMEGGVEVVRGDRRAARGSKLYIDLPKAVAWLDDAELVYPLMSEGQEVPLRVRTGRLGTDEEGRLTAEDATLTTCDHDVPHFVVRTRKFALEPREDGRWRFSARGNRLKFEGGLSLPLPSIGNLILDEEFGVDGFENEAGEVTPLRDIGIARTARFGTVLGAAFRFDIGDVGSWIAERIGMDSSKLRGKWESEAQWLSGRGPLVGLGLQLREREPGDNPDEDFRMDAFVGGILDDGRDRGTVRVDQEDREDLRVTGYVRARYPIVRGEWFDFAGASQTDAGVQAEFYEGDFLRFEQRDTFVRWRKSFGADYLAAGAQKRVNSFRSQKEELPSFAAYRGEREIGTFTGLPVLWGGSFDAGYFQRREGEVGQDLFSDLPGGARAGLGDQSTARADLFQRLSLPVQTSFAAIRATPFAEMRGTAWTNALDAGDDPRRGALRTGLELSTTLHKVTDNGYLHALAPRVSYSTDVANDQTGGSLIPLDETEAPIDGTQVEFGLRSLWQRPGTFENLDIDVSALFLQNRDDGVADSSQLASLAQYITRYGNGEGQIGIRHDGRYDLEDAETTYSRSAFAVRPNDSFLVEFRYSQARDIFDAELYETGGIIGRWRLDPKWELETRYVHDLKDDQQLLTELTVRRYAHDFVFDMIFQDRSGEGGVNLSFNLAPLLGWTANRFGMLDR